MPPQHLFGYFPSNDPHQSTANVPCPPLQSGLSVSVKITGMYRGRAGSTRLVRGTGQDYENPLLCTPPFGISLSPWQLHDPAYASYVVGVMVMHDRAATWQLHDPAAKVRVKMWLKLCSRGYGYALMFGLRCGSSLVLGLGLGCCM